MSVPSVEIEAPGRLAFTLIDLEGTAGRINGGAGVAIAEPSFRCAVAPSSSIGIDHPLSNPFPYSRETADFLIRLLNYLDCPPVHIRVLSHIPAHLGFGSKTATLLAVGRAVSALFDKPVNTAAVATLAGRGRTSGVGVNTFDRGGFVVDGGHAVDPGRLDLHDLFLPTRFSQMRSIPPVLFRGRFPWPLTIVVPKGRIIEGEVEVEHFRKVCPMPLSSAHEIAHLVCFRMASAVAEADYVAFCRAVNDLQQTYWKASQIANQTDEFRGVLSEARSHGFDAMGITSNGPALYGLTQRSEVTDAWLTRLTVEGVVRDFWSTSVPTRGARITRENHDS